MTEPSFLELVPIHERKWGTESYPGRPDLSELLTCSIVVMWTYKGRFMFSIHQQADEVNELVYRLISGDKTLPMRDWKLIRIFVNQQPIEFQIKIVSMPKAAEKVAKADTKSSGLVVLGEPRCVPYIDDNDLLAAKGAVIRTHASYKVLPGRNINHRKRSEGRRTP